MRTTPKGPPNPDVITITVNQTKPKTDKPVSVATAAVTTATNALKRCQIAAATTAS
ncbi:MAG: hypothetical protein P8L78_14955 [Mariniblastus sp.]|nr:hypothetical protein [Mariniblastus sp.]